MSSRAGTQLLGELCVLTALMISVLCMWCNTGQGKEGEKVLLTGWMLQKRRCMVSPVAVTSFFP